MNKYDLVEMIAATRAIKNGIGYSLDPQTGILYVQARDGSTQTFEADRFVGPHNELLQRMGLNPGNMKDFAKAWDGSEV